MKLTKVKLLYAHSKTEPMILFFEKFALENFEKNGRKGLEKYDELITLEANDFFKVSHTNRVISYDNTALAEKMFEVTNSPYVKNPLSTKEMQQKIRDSKCGHTSMSVGDLVEIIHDEDGKSNYQLCCNSGFRDVTKLIEVQK